jgi:hypothetical protein
MGIGGYTQVYDGIPKSQHKTQATQAKTGD